MKIFIKNKDNKRDTEIEREKELFRLPKMRLCLHTHKYLHIGKTSQLNIRIVHSLVIHLILCKPQFTEHCCHELSFYQGKVIAD